MLPRGRGGRRDRRAGRDGHVRPAAGGRSVESAGGAERRGGAGGRTAHRERGRGDPRRSAPADLGEPVPLRPVAARTPHRAGGRARGRPGRRRPHRARRRAVVQGRSVGRAARAVDGQRAADGPSVAGRRRSPRRLPAGRRVLRRPRPARKPLRLALGHLPGPRPGGGGARRRRTAHSRAGRRGEQRRRHAGRLVGGGARRSGEPARPRPRRHAAGDGPRVRRGGGHARGAGPRARPAVAAARCPRRPQRARAAGGGPRARAALSGHAEHQLHPRPRLGAHVAARGP